MFYAIELLSHKGVLAAVWLSGTRPGTQSTRQLLDVDLADVCAVSRGHVARSQRTNE